MSMNHDHENEVIYFGKTNFRNAMTKFGIKTDDRRRHMYVIGKTGMGKSTLMENLMLSDIYAGHGCCYIDPHGDAAEKLVDFIPSWRLNDVVYFNPADLDYPVGFNILEAVSERHKHLVASGMMGVFAKIWEGMWSSRMEYILNNTILALLDNQGQTLLGINRMMSDAEYRKRMVGNIKDPVVKQFWVKEFASWTEKYATEATAAIQNKIGQFLSASVIRNIVSQVKSTINVREIMDSNKIFIVNLSKGRVGEDNSRLLGGLLVTKIQLSAMERVDTPEHLRDDFYLYVDEFQNFAVDSFASILSEARKYRLCLTMAHQYIAQLSEAVRDAVFGNVGTMVTFRVGSPDAMFMEQEFMPRFTPEDIINLPKYNVYLKLLIDGVTSMPFSAVTLPPIAEKTHSSEKVIKVSRERYAAPREQIEEKILIWSGMADQDVEDLYKEAEKKKKAASGGGGKGGKPRHEYNCTRCDTDIVLPVELDRSRPIYCDDCITIVREEKKKGGKRPPKPKAGDKPKTGDKSARDDRKKDDRKKTGSSEKKEPRPEPPKPAETEVVEKPVEEAAVGLDALRKDTKGSSKEFKDESKGAAEAAEESSANVASEDAQTAGADETRSEAQVQGAAKEEVASKKAVEPVDQTEPAAAAELKKEPQVGAEAVAVEPVKAQEPAKETAPREEAPVKSAASKNDRTDERGDRSRGERTSSRIDDKKRETRREKRVETRKEVEVVREVKSEKKADEDRAPRQELERAPSEKVDAPKAETPHVVHDSGDYTCSDCTKNFTADVKLDRSRPMYCEDCLEKIRAERRKDQGKEKGASTPRKSRESNATREQGQGRSSDAPKKKRKRRRKKKSSAGGESRSSTGEGERKPKERIEAAPKKEQPAPAQEKTNPETTAPSVQSGTLKSGQAIRFD